MADITFGHYIKSARLSKKLTLRALESKIDVSIAFISQIENNEKNPSPDILRKFSCGLDIPYLELMKRSGFITEYDLLQETEITDTDQPINLSIGQHISNQRKKLNISQTELANKLGITKGFLSKMENGQKPISLKRLAQLSKILQIDIFNFEYENHHKWDPVIEMFESNNILPEEVLLLEDFIRKLKS